MSGRAAGAGYDVAIVGYGPVGAILALQLADAGLRVVVVERSTAVVDLPRAVGFDGESVRAFQRLGFADEITGILQPYREGDEVCFANSNRERLFGQPLPPREPGGWRVMSFFDQPELEALLREWVAREPKIDVFLGHEVSGVEQSGQGVTLDAGGPAGATLRLVASYLVGCDGASSFVRGAVGVEWESLGYDQDWLVVDIVQSDAARLPRVTMQICDPERLATYVCVKDPNRRWEFQLRPGETREEMLEPARIQSLLDDWLPREHYELRRAAVYQFHAATASRWREGRVFLAGDAAHQTPPFLGQGLNSGIRDAVSLGWKIPLVLAGVCGDALLDTYEAERDPHAKDLVQWAVAIGQLMETLAAREAGLPDPHPPPEQATGFGQGRLTPPLRGGVLVAEQVGRTESTGEQLAQPTVATRGCQPCRFDELLGKGFALVARDDAALGLSESSRHIVKALDVRIVTLDDLEVREGALDRVFERSPAAVVRPDRFVYGVVEDTWSLDALLSDLAKKVALLC